MGEATCATMRQGQVEDQSACGEELQWKIQSKRSDQVVEWCQEAVKHLSALVKKSELAFGCLGLITV
jgi:hypothetical protein